MSITMWEATRQNTPVNRGYQIGFFFKRCNYMVSVKDVLIFKVTKNDSKRREKEKIYNANSKSEKATVAISTPDKAHLKKRSITSDQDIT